MRGIGPGAPTAQRSESPTQSDRSLPQEHSSSCLWARWRIYTHIYIYSHVHSHILHPFNDYVDSICTHVKDKFRRTSLAIGPIGIELIRSADHYCAHLCSSVSQQLVLGDEAHLGHLASIEPKCIGRSIDGDGMSPLEAVHDGLYTREVKGVQYNICTGTPVN